MEAAFHRAIVALRKATSVVVCGHVRHQAEQLGRERPLRQRHGARASDPGRYLDDVVVGKAGERAPVLDVDDLDVARVGGE